MYKKTIIAGIVVGLIAVGYYVISPPSLKGTLNDDTATEIGNAMQNNQQQVDDTTVEKTAVFANGCFWCVEHDLEKVAGVIDVVSGYAGGREENPMYENYAEGGHREAVLVTYDARTVTYSNLVEHILKHGDPTDADGSFGDRGSQYAPAIYYENETERDEAYRVIQAVDALRIFSAPVSLPVMPRVKFWPAEEYHQDYSAKNPVRYTYYRTASGRDAFIKKGIQTIV